MNCNLLIVELSVEVDNYVGTSKFWNWNLENTKMHQLPIWNTHTSNTTYYINQVQKKRFSRGERR